MEIYSIGFTQKTAERFFTRIKDAGIRLLLDVRLNNVSQLGGFAKRADLAFFLGYRLPFEAQVNRIALRVLGSVLAHALRVTGSALDHLRILGALNLCGSFMGAFGHDAVHARALAC